MTQPSALPTNASVVPPARGGKVVVYLSALLKGFGGFSSQPVGRASLAHTGLVKSPLAFGHNGRVLGRRLFAIVLGTVGVCIGLFGVLLLVAPVGNGPKLWAIPTWAVAIGAFAVAGLLWTKPSGSYQAPAGWYPDPEDGMAWRWWDGSAWSAPYRETVQPPP